MIDYYLILIHKEGCIQKKFITLKDVNDWAD